MNLLAGNIVEGKEAAAVLAQLPARILATLEKKPLDSRSVIEACHRLVTQLDEEKYLQIMMDLGISRTRGEAYLQEARRTFSRDYLTARLARELGATLGQEQTYRPAVGAQSIRETICPLGVLLHIPAGNADGLPAFSVLEGLLTGNINILKLPEVDGGISVLLLKELIREEPVLAEYIYVFDYSSKDTLSISQLIAVADGVVIWGGDEAVTALRATIPANVKIIEWGHKVSFAYATKAGRTEAALTQLARHICRTNQVLCTSAQGIYLDVEDATELDDFCTQFLPILETETARHDKELPLPIQAQITLQQYSLELELSAGGNKESPRLFRGRGCSLLASRDPALAPAIQFRHGWVKPMPRNRILAQLRPYKNHLQTVGLLCAEAERASLVQIFQKTGVVRVTAPANMSDTYCGAAHDGEYGLRRYTKKFSLEGFVDEAKEE